MTQKKETAHEKFLRLMQKRLGRVLEEVRLVCQLSSRNYESTKAERLEVVHHLDAAVKKVAATYDVPYESKIGDKVVQPANKVQAALTAEQVAAVVDLLDYGRLPEALDILRPALPVEAPETDEAE